MNPPKETSVPPKVLAAALAGAVLCVFPGVGHAKQSLQPLTVEDRGTDSGGGSGSSTDNDNARGQAPLCDQTSVTNSSEFERTFSCDRMIGNDTFGAGYEYTGGVYAWKNGGNHKRRYDGRMWVGGTVFGYDAAIYEASVFVETTDDNGHYGELTLRFDREAIYGPEPVHSAFGASPGHSETLLEQTAPFAVGPFTIKVTAGVAAHVGVNLDGSVGTDIYAKLTPNAAVTAYGAIKVALPLNVASAEVAAELDIITLDMPIDGAVKRSGSGYTWSLDGDIEFGSLSGRVKVTAKALFDLITLYKAIIAEWDGFTATYDAYDKSGSFSF